MHRVCVAQVGTLSASLKSGSASVHNSSVAATSLHATGSGSIYVLEAPTAGLAVTVRYRQPSNRVCVASDAAAVFAEAPPLAGPG